MESHVLALNELQLKSQRELLMANEIEQTKMKQQCANCEEQYIISMGICYRGKQFKFSVIG